MRHKIAKPFIKVGFLLLALVALAAGIAIPASAAPSASPNIAVLHTLAGTVQSITAPNLVVLTANNQSVTISTDSNTVYYAVPMGKVQGYIGNQTAADNRADKKAGLPIQSPAGQLKELHIPANWRSDLGWLATFDSKANLSNIAVGDRVFVRAESNNLAKQVLIIKAAVNRTVKGNIVLTGPTQISITATGATAISLNVTTTTQIILKGVTSISGYASVLYNSSNNNALVVNVQATAPNPSAAATVPPAVTLISIAITPAPASLQVGKTQQFTAMGTYSNSVSVNITGSVTWSSSNPTSASFPSSGGLATAAAAGSTSITASQAGITSPAVVLTVVSP